MSMSDTPPENAAPLTSPEMKPIVIPFADDSTLFFALRLRDILWNTPDMPCVQLAWVSDQNALSYRQMSQLLPEGPDRILRERDFHDLILSGTIEAVITSRVFRPLGNVLKCKLVKHMANRACVISFLGGLDFFPERGYVNRRDCDAVYLFPASEIQVFSDLMLAYDTSWQDVRFGHPAAVGPSPPPKNLARRRDIYFFAQALSPTTRQSRQHMLEICISLARAYTDRTVWIKLRHLPLENRQHLHKERFDYPSLLKQMQDVPDNLKLTACSMEEAFAQMAVGLTCTSTAAIDVIREGIPCMVYLDYVDYFNDPLNPHMRRLFADSGLITNLDDVLNLRSHAPKQLWMDNMFCSPDLGKRLLTTINDFKIRPFQLPQKTAPLPT